MSSPPGGAVGGHAAAEPAGEGLKAVNGTHLWVKRLGSGPPIVVVHGGPLLDHGYLVEPLAPLAEDHELIFFDQRLSGRSDAEVDEASVRLATLVEDIEALRSALGLGRMHLMAHSWGGFLAMQYALRHPARLESLLLLDSMAASSKLFGREQQAVAERVTAEDRALRQEIMASEAFAERSSEAIASLLELSYRAQFADPAKLDRLQLYVPADYSERSARFAALGPELAEFDLHERLGGLEVPTLLVYGDAEPGADLGGAAIHAALPGSELVVIEGAGHFPFVEQPERFLGAVRAFLAALPAGAEPAGRRDDGQRP